MAYWVRTFKLFHYLTMEPQDTLSKASLGDLVPYQMFNADASDKKLAAEYWCFNDITKFGDLQALCKTATDNDPFQINKDNTVNPIPAE